LLGFWKKQKSSLVRYSDFAGDRDRMTSLSSYVFALGACAISWKAASHATVELST